MIATITRPLAAAALLSAVAVTALSASSPRFFQAATPAEFLLGDVDNLAIDSGGNLVLGPATELVYETASPFLWALTPAADGSLFVGTGNDGRVFRIDARGNGTAIFDAVELEAHALTPAPDGGMYVGSSPDGRIYKIDRNGASTTFYEPGEKYIWALATGPDGALYAATGERGNIYRITPQGEGTRFYQVKATHATALAFDPSGNLLVGTESPGRVLRVDPQGRAFVLLDSPFQEISALRFDDQGRLYVAAVSGRPGAVPSAPPPVDVDRAPADTSRAPVPSVSVEITSMAVVDAGVGSSAPTSTAEDRRSARGAVYRIAPDGLWDQLWESRDDSPYDLTFDAEGRLIIGTGNRGKIYRLEGDPLRPTLLASAAAQQVTAFHRDGSGRLYYATANPGKVYRLASGRAARGTYQSQPRDAQMVASWGALSWHGTVPKGAGVAISTRSGNTETPDDTWSPWSDPYDNPQGSPITSPKARFLQWRAVLTSSGDTPVLTSVTAAYLQRNLPPQVRSLTVHPPGIVFQRPFTTGEPDLAGFENQTTPIRELTSAAMAQGGGSSLGRRTYQKGLQTLIWRAEDQNDDQLSYEVRFRREGESTWRLLRGDLRDPILVWDTTTMPNGTYFVKVVASDAPSNPPDGTLVGEMESSTFEIDNTAPLIAVQNVRAQGGRTVVTFEVQDDHSPVQRVEYSGDGQQWRPVFPADGIADTRVERYQVTIDGTLGPRGLSVRATDSMNNVATTQVEPPPGPAGR